ncbi:hypothetical protein LCGC14_3021710, partial [marine sediment metagenome]
TTEAEPFFAYTANKVWQLPPELSRKGRLSEVFFVDLPTYAEREAIWRDIMGELR